MPSNGRQASTNDPLARYRNEASIDEDTGSFRSIDDISRIETVTDEPIVYGLDNMPTPDPLSRRPGMRLPMPLVVAGILVALLAAGYLLVLRPFLRHGSQQAPAQEVAERAETPAPTKQADAAQVLQVIGSLEVDGEAIGLSESVSVEMARGRLVVTHAIDGAGADPLVTFERGLQRAAALAADLQGYSVQGEGEDAASPLSEVTWVVSNLSGEPFMCVSYPAGVQATTDVSMLVGQAGGYAVSDGLYASMGEAGGTYAQRAGAAPIDLSGMQIEPTAELPMPEGTD